VWSHDGKWIYYLSASSPQSHDLWRVDATTGSSEQLTVNALYHFDPAVREDALIAYSGNSGGDYDLWTLEAGESPQRLTQDPALDAHPTWSPDGRSLIFESTREGGVSQLWRIDLETRKVSRITRIDGGARMPAWAPVGKRP
jgi:Tol biopolymer transport system component